MNNIILICCIVVLGLALIYLGYHAYKDFSENKIVSYDVASGENDPYLKQVAEFRQSFVDNVLENIGVVWFINPNTLQLKIETTDWNNHLITVVHDNHLIRCYVDWKKQKVRIVYSFCNDYFDLSKGKTFKIKNHTLNYEKMSTWVSKVYTIILLNCWPDHDDRAAECIREAKKIIDDKNMTQEAYNEMMFSIWRDYVIHIKKEEVEHDLLAYTKLTAYVLKNCPELLKDFIEEQKRIKEK